MRNLLYTAIFCLFTIFSFAQSAGRALNKGNEGYEQKHYTQAEAAYRIAKSKSPKSTADYNMGNTLYKQNHTKEAITALTRATKTATTKAEKHRAFHNLGNVYMKNKNYQEAEKAYKSALLNNPKDDETRYNYAVAKKLNEENPQQNDDNKDDQNKDNKDNKDDQNKDNKDNKDDQNKDNKDNKDDQNKDNKDNKDDQNKDNKDNKDDQNKDNKDNKDDQNKDNKPQNNPQAPSRDQIDRILDAMNQKEKDIQQRLINKGKKGDKGEGQAVPAGQRKKDW
ncbi:tetratricopeptide repeat protein [Myroides phaeus]|uniref:Tetratricopeptide repeat-containing protein n=2 Tax=Myroides phaeus TaxID=702745 RepID=A0A1G8B621_9FLAO|nr:tetratricopeptide repeat protein [Myroides phaeus]SDH28595.1 Tetratricopeptide repeat-containing protein [Myroides phaeus]